METETAAEGADAEGARRALEGFFRTPPDTEAVRGFVPCPGVVRLGRFFDPERLREACDEVLSRESWSEGGISGGKVSAVSLTQVPGEADSRAGDSLVGRYWTRPDSTYEEVPRKEPVDEARFSEFVERFRDTYFHEVWRTLSRMARIGRMRLLLKDPRTTTSWHRDPEPRLHVPIRTNPGALMLLNNSLTHLPADGSVYFTDTRGYHCAMNGGEEPRVHIVAALPLAAGAPGGA